MSGDSHMDLQQSGSWNHERDDGEDEQVLQPKIKRKRSIRIRPRLSAEKQEDRNGDGVFPQRGSHLAFQGDGDYDSQFKFEQDARSLAEPVPRAQDAVHPIAKQKRNMSSRKVSPASRTGGLAYLSGSGEGSTERSKENWSVKAIDSAMTGRTKMSDSMQRKVGVHFSYLYPTAIWLICCMTLSRRNFLSSIIEYTISSRSFIFMASARSTIYIFKF